MQNQRRGWSLRSLQFSVAYDLSVSPAPVLCRDPAKAVWAAAASLGITLAPLPGYSPDLMLVEALWRWMREDVTYHHCHATADDLTQRVAAFQNQINKDPCAVADRLWVKDHLDPDEEKLRFPN